MVLNIGYTNSRIDTLDELAYWLEDLVGVRGVLGSNQAIFNPISNMSTYLFFNVSTFICLKLLKGQSFHLSMCTVISRQIRRNTHSMVTLIVL